MNRHISVAGLVALMLAMASTASATLLVYEPFAYPDGWLTDQGGALGTVGTWTAWDTHNGDWYVHPEGETSGIVVDPGPPIGRNMFDGTVANLATSGGYAGLPGPEDIGRDPDEDFEIGRYMTASIALDAGVTATFQSGTTTWFSYVTARGWDRNERAAHLIIGTDPTPDNDRGLTLLNSGSGIGGGGGPPRDNRTDIFPQYFLDGENYHSPSPFGGSGGPITDYPNEGANELPDDTHTMPWERLTPEGDFGPPNIVVGKIEWDADIGGEDIISVVRFLETDTLSEAAFDALIADKPALSSANWDSNQPDLDQSQFDMLDLSGTKVFVDEIRLGTTFEDVAPTFLTAVLQPGDADMDCDFDQLDLVRVQVAAKYLTGEAATWGEGDWDGAPGGSAVDKVPPAGNGTFDQLDIIAALNGNVYLTGSYCAAEALVGQALPEPATFWLLAVGSTGLLLGRRRRR
jgi:hypothetical protein